MSEPAICPHCGQPIPLLRNDAENRIDELREWRRDNGHWISPFDTASPIWRNIRFLALESLNI